jgi:hypothetical protein
MYMYSNISMSYLTCQCLILQSFDLTDMSYARSSASERSSPQRGLHALDVLPAKQAFPDIRHARIIIN